MITGQDDWSQAAQRILTGPAWWIVLVIPLAVLVTAIVVIRWAKTGSGMVRVQWMKLLVEADFSRTSERQEGDGEDDAIE